VVVEGVLFADGMSRSPRSGDDSAGNIASNLVAIQYEAAADYVVPFVENHVTGVVSFVVGDAAPWAASVESAPAEAAPVAEPEAAPEEPQEDESSCPVNRPAEEGPHSFVGSTPVLMADGSTKPISQVKVGDQISDSVPGDSGRQTQTVQNVITTTTDRDFVDVTVKPSKLGKALAGVALAAAATLTTTFHHPFYDITQSAFVEAVDLKPGDQVQTTDGGTATVTDVHAYHQQATTYDLTINGLHTYFVLAGDTPVLVHNCGTGDEPYDLREHVRQDSARSSTSNTAAAVARDTYTGETAYGESGAVPGNVHPDLMDRLRAAQELVDTPARAEEWQPGTCAEFHACNNAMNDLGARLDELEYYTINRRDGSPKASCGWCTMILGGPGGATERTGL
jgi:hypothetical protein